MRNLLLMSLVLMTSVVHAKKGSEGVGGGDICEDQIKIIRDDIAQWITKDGHKSLIGINPNQYAENMQKQISTAKVRCVGKGDKDYPVKVFGTPKVCRFDTGLLNSSTITCSREEFMKMDEDNQYVLVHHEYAGLAGIELPNKDDSQYEISNQISKYLVSKVVKKLAVKENSAESNWEQIDGTEGTNIANALQGAIAVTNFSDCSVDFEVPPTPEDRQIMCDAGEYYARRFNFVSKKDGDGFYGIPAGEFNCHGILGKDKRFLMRDKTNPSILKNLIDRSVYPEINTLSNDHLQLNTTYELDSTDTKILKVTVEKTKIVKVNIGTVSKPVWGFKAIPLRKIECNAK